MKLPRRQFLHLAAGAAALPGVARIARAQAYPMRPVRIIVGYSAGSASDIVARLIAQWLSERLGHQFVVENRAEWRQFGRPSALYIDRNDILYAADSQSGEKFNAPFSAGHKNRQRLRQERSEAWRKSLRRRGQQPDGTLQGRAWRVGRDGVTPPM